MVPYKQQVTSPGPIAVKLGQTRVHAPEHLTLGFVTCDVCPEKFAIGPNRLFGSKHDEASCVAELKRILADDHGAARAHLDHYEVLD
ncbi:MAG: hypothetical protein ACRD11_06680 [Terriglobia bacterium]